MDPTPSVWLRSHYFFPFSKSFKVGVCSIAAQGLQAKVLFIQFVSSRISFPVWKNKNQLNSSTIPPFLPFHGACAKPFLKSTFFLVSTGL